MPVLAPVMMTVFPSSLALLRQTRPAKYRLMTAKLTPTNVDQDESNVAVDRWMPEHLLSFQ